MDLQQYKAEDFILNDSFVRYCLRTNDADVQFWESWLNKHPHKQAEAAKAQSWLFKLNLRLTPEEKTAAFLELQTAIATENNLTPIIPIPRTRNRKRLLRIAAAVTLLLGAAAGSFFLRHAPRPIAAAYTIYQAGDSMRRHIQLPDGSAVLLNARSTLKVPATYNAGQRQLELNGEALFEVAAAAGQPFIVSSGNLHIQALGTAFKVRAYTFDTTMAVSLLNGRVQVAQAGDSMLLLPGEQITTRKEGAAFDKHTFDINRETAWRSGRLSFDKATLAEVAHTLEYWYGVKVVVQPGKYKPIRFNGTFTNKTLQEVLTAICFVNGLSTTEKNDTLYIQSTKH
ncbi:FecR family protein [Chitinophaga nivalis]|uniref:DUF4974 domain-containing protein n=1 Tax=Chitinophaga nivalis TaxID=2991709 RepID=A0ABT3INW7_9BACT|nr:FecR family protein [Chitinophaga nivalis]MCW3464643.1 DUF4974 domain-containing protein [Chitinophaga nivalis]MCW3485666.1 DUF4974 domain-containing protein [Chitinophaga nivalis]